MLAVRPADERPKRSPSEPDVKSFNVHNPIKRQRSERTGAVGRSRNRSVRELATLAALCLRTLAAASLGFSLGRGQSAENAVR